MSELPPVFTIGHSTRTIPEFVELLQRGSVDMVVDVRSFPRSRTNPQYNIETLPDALADYQIRHTRIGELGGRRKKSASVPAELNAYWINQAFHNYADYMQSEEFLRGLERLEALSGVQRCAVMCSEAVWWRCHRRFIADCLLSQGREVFHLMGNDRIDPAKTTPGARPEGDVMVYPPTDE